MILAFATDTRPPLVTVPQFLLLIALAAAILALIVTGTQRWKQHRASSRD
jgi:hypothetical protein